MFGIPVEATARTNLFTMAKGLKPNPRHQADPSLLVASHDDRYDDLPCPWCYAPTLEEDRRCSGCGRTFG